MSNLNMLGPILDFTSAEAYKLLRSNIVFSLPEDKDCYVIGVTSSERAEGKSVNSINTAYTFAEQGRKVLLIEGDMRIPGISPKLAIQSSPGLSNALVSSHNRSEAVIRLSGLHDNLHVLSSGDIPPNPSELLSSRKMEVLLDTLKKSYDYIFIDLPPVNVVSDALAISPLLDGIVFVVREDYATKRSVANAIKQLEFSNVKILGFVVTFAKLTNTKYYKYKKKERKPRGYEYEVYNPYKTYGPKPETNKTTQAKPEEGTV